MLASPMTRLRVWPSEDSLGRPRIRLAPALNVEETQGARPDNSAKFADVGIEESDRSANHQPRTLTVVGDSEGSTVATPCRRMFRKSGGGGNCTRSQHDANTESQCSYGKHPLGRPEIGREDEALCELVAIWHRLTPSVRTSIMDLSRRG